MLFRLLILAIAGAVIYRAAKTWLGGSGPNDDRYHAKPPEQVDDVMIKDPVCGAYFARHSGVKLAASQEVLYFCSAECRDRFEAHPSRYR